MRLAGVHPGEVREELEAEGGFVVEGTQDVGHVLRLDPDLGLVVALPDRPGQGVAEARREAGLDGSIHRLRLPPARLGPPRAPASGRADP